MDVASNDDSFVKTNVVFVYAQWCHLIPTVREGSNRAWFGTNQSESRELSDTLSADELRRQNREEALLGRSPPAPLFLWSARVKLRIRGNSQIYTSLTPTVFKEDQI